MKADEIRTWAAEVTENDRDITQNGVRWVDVVQAQALFEIAAQLAELNAKLPNMSVLSPDERLRVEVKGWHE